MTTLSDALAIIKKISKNDWTLVITKPDAIEKDMVDEIFDIFKRKESTILYQKFIHLPAIFWKLFYPSNQARLVTLGKRIIANNIKAGIDTKALLGTVNPLEIGKIINAMIVDYMTKGEVGITILVGEDIRNRARDICGPTLPEKNKGLDTIRALSKDTHKKAMLKLRTVYNLIHCSDPEEIRYCMGTPISAPVYELALIVLLFRTNSIR